jgi:hypothetical protein
VLKNVVDKKPRKNSTGVISVWIGLEGKKLEPNRTEINRFEPVFGSVPKLKKKNRFGCLFWSKTGPNRKCSALQFISIDPFWYLKIWWICYFKKLSQPKSLSC